MALKFYNTLTAKKDVFFPMKKDLVRMYTCGPTVYDFAHIGNFRAYIFEDLLRRYLKYKGYSVVQVMNLTDVDDKTIAGAQQSDVSLEKFTHPFIEAFFEDLDTLNIERAEYYPRATEHIQEMIGLIGSLLDLGIAYKSEGSVYFKIRKFPAYGKLSKKNIEKNIVGTRVDHDEYERGDFRDFVLWKKTKPGEPSWDSPFGTGRPGWHIECSAMSMKYLGSSFDIHTGGEDNIFPHHENEIAQSEAVTGGTFVNYWLHCKYLLVENEKMSKSKGNFYTLRALVAKGYSPLAIRYLLITHNYRQPLNFTLQGLEHAQSSLNRIKNFLSNLNFYSPGPKANDSCYYDVEQLKQSFEASLNDDLNIAQAMAALFDFIFLINKRMKEDRISFVGKEYVINTIIDIDAIFGFRLAEAVHGVAHDSASADVEEGCDQEEKEVKQLVEDRQRARGEKDFAKADELRDAIDERGWIVEDTPNGPRLKRK